jgi:hypothetical protein
MKLDLKIEGGDGSVADYPLFAEHLRKLAALKRRVDDIYTFAYFRDEEGLEYSPHDSNLLAKVYENPKSAKRGVVIVNTGTEERNIKLKVKMTGPGHGYVLHRLDGQVERIAVEKQLDVKLSAYDVQVLEVQ